MDCVGSTASTTMQSASERHIVEESVSERTQIKFCCVLLLYAVPCWYGGANDIPIHS
jgi:hypothetical protein